MRRFSKLTFFVQTIFEVGKHAKEGLQLMQKTRKLHESRVVSRDFVPELLPASPAVPDGKAQKKLASASEAQLQSSFKAIYASNSSQSKYDPGMRVAIQFFFFL